jgi:predicted patatin/cPLA2 family phospholipase
MAVEVLGPQHVGMDDYEPHPVKDMMIERLVSGSRRGEREDGFEVAVAIEGGGFAGVVSGAELVVMEQAGLVKTVDKMIGTSSGALNGASTAAEQAALGWTNYPDLLGTKFINQWRIPFGRRGINFDRLICDIMLARKPYDPEKLAVGPDFGAVAVNLSTMEAELLKDFNGIEDMLLAIRASCAMPVMTGPPVMYKGKPMSDGALLASVPFRAALDDGATHVLALRSRGEDYRKSKYSGLNVETVRIFGSSALAELVEDRPRIYNLDADELQEGSDSVLQIAVPGDEEPVGQLEKSLARIRNGFDLGMTAVGKAFGMPELSVSWQGVPTIMVNH